jgi:hypothetical protein
MEHHKFPKGIGSASEAFSLRLAMKRHDRYFQFDNIEQGEPVLSRCSVCKKEFQDEPKPKEGTDDLLLRIRAAFEAHVCSGM